MDPRNGLDGAKFDAAARYTTTKSVTARTVSGGES
jgi:hypothetical protein